MKSFRRRHHTSRALILILASVVSLPVAAQCWEEQPIGFACDFTTCDESASCNSSSVLTHENEEVTIVTSGGNRDLISSVGYLCYMSWLESDPQTGYCTLRVYCDTITNGQIAHGGICPGGLD